MSEREGEGGKIQEGMSRLYAVHNWYYSNIEKIKSKGGLGIMKMHTHMLIVTMLHIRISMYKCIYMCKYIYMYVDRYL